MFKGSIVALVTPMDRQGALDLEAFRALIEFHADNGTAGLVVAGTTGESAALDGDEFERLLRVAVESSAGRMPIIAGTGTASTAKTVAMTRKAAALGADAALVVTPYYNRPTQSGLVAHFSAVADGTDLPIILYNVPTRTGVDMRAETTLSLATHERIIGVKEAVADPARVTRLLDGRPEGFAVLSGDDGSCAASMLSGAEGVISVAANVAPSRMSALCNAAIAGSEALAKNLDSELQELFRQMGIETNPIPAKWALFEMGLIQEGIRLPLQPLASGYREGLRACLRALEII